MLILFFGKIAVYKWQHQDIETNKQRVHLCCLKKSNLVKQIKSRYYIEVSVYQLKLGSKNFDQYIFYTVLGVTFLQVSLLYIHQV